MKADDIFLIHGFLICEDIAYLSSYHSHITDRFAELVDHMSISRESETLHTHSLESISDEYTRRFSIFFPDGELSSTKFVIVHGWKVIMDE